MKRYKEKKQENIPHQFSLILIVDLKHIYLSNPTSKKIKVRNINKYKIPTLKIN
jgi:hypothetical protein